MTAPSYSPVSVSGAHGISRGARRAVIAITVLLTLYGAGIGWTAARAVTLADNVRATQDGVQKSRLESCRASNSRFTKFDTAIHAVFNQSASTPQAQAALRILDAALRPSDCRVVIRVRE